MREMLMWITGLALCCAAFAGEPDQPAFVGKPTATRDGQKVKIRFAVDRKTDVTVSIENAAGRTVRHVVAGVLGKNPPEPLKAGVLAQELEWDLRDDEGKPAVGGPFTVRIKLGMRPKLDSFLVDNPDQLGMVISIATDDKGRLVVLNGNPARLAHPAGEGIKVFGRDGRYERTLMPFPASLPVERLGDCKPFVTDSGELVPRLTDVFARSFYPHPSISPYQSIAVDGKGRVFLMTIGPRVAAVDLEGGLPFEQFHGPVLLANVKGLNATNRWTRGSDTPRLAVSSDGKWLYLTGLTRDGRKATPVPCVFRLDIEKRGPAEAFAGDLAKAGKENGLLTAPAGLAAARGLLYVADRAAGRIVAFKEDDRSFAGEIKAVGPVAVAADPKSGMVYALCQRAKKRPTVIKFSALPEGREICRLDLPPVGAPDRPIFQLTLDAGGKPPVLWAVVNGGNRNWLSQTFWRFTDMGSAFSKPADPRSKEPSAEHGNDLSVDRRRGELYVRTEGPIWVRMNERTGKITDPRFTLSGGGSFNCGPQIVVGEDGGLYSWWWLDRIGRFDHDGKPVRWPGQDASQLKLYPPMSFLVRGLYVKSAQEMYGVVRNIADLKPGQTTGPQAWWTTVNLIGPDAKSRRTVIWECSQGAVLKLDRKGNIYLADMVKPAGRSYPEFFDGKLDPPPSPGPEPAASDRSATSWFYGSILKFPPEGGAIWYGPEFKRRSKDGGPRFTWVGRPPADLLAKPKRKFSAHVGYVTRGDVEVQNALWVRFGYSPLTVGAGGSNTCMCEGSKFDVDEYGRVFFPNLNQFRVEVVDTNGNPIGTFGGYGNLDSTGKGGRLPGPDIPLAWPLSVAVSDTHAYVGDTLNRRVAKVKLTAAVEETVLLP
jgi:hypothetical protein